MNEADLKKYFEKVRNGDKDAFIHIYNEMKKPVFTVVCRIVGELLTAEDITQEVFLRLFTSPPDSSVKNPRAWIFRVARNLAVDALRKKQSLSIDDMDLAAQSEIDEIPARLDVEAAIKKLPDTERQILVLHLNGGLKFAEIASVMGLSLSAAYRRYRKALKTLRVTLEVGDL